MAERGIRTLEGLLTLTPLAGPIMNPPLSMPLWELGYLEPFCPPLSIAVSGRLSVPFRTDSFHSRSVSQALPGSPGAPARAVPAAARCRRLPKFSTKSGHLARSHSRTRQKAAAPRAWRSARIRPSQKAGGHWLVLERSYFKFIRSAMLEKLAGLKAKPAGE